MEYEYNVGEIYVCGECGMRVVITQTAVPVQELSCCGTMMDLNPTDSGEEEHDSKGNTEYEVTEEYYCPVCGLECRILSGRNPSLPLSCCGVPMELK